MQRPHLLRPHLQTDKPETCEKDLRFSPELRQEKDKDLDFMGKMALLDLPFFSARQHRCEKRTAKLLLYLAHEVLERDEGGPVLRLVRPALLHQLVDVRRAVVRLRQPLRVLVQLL